MSQSRDQKRREKLAEREKRRARMNVAFTLPKDKIAAVVHQAVCTFAQCDGYGHCAHYAVAGSTLISMLTQKLYVPQAGTLQIICDGDQGLMMDAKQGGIRSGEFHSWIVGPVGFGNPGKHKIPADMEVIDFSSRHYRNYVEKHRQISDRFLLPDGCLTIVDSETPRASWRLPDPPDYIWTPFRNLPNWMRVSAEQDATDELLASTTEFKPLMRLVAEIWKKKYMTKTP